MSFCTPKQALVFLVLILSLCMVFPGSSLAKKEYVAGSGMGEGDPGDGLDSYFGGSGSGYNSDLFAVDGDKGAKIQDLWGYFAQEYSSYSILIILPTDYNGAKFFIIIPREYASQGRFK